MIVADEVTEAPYVIDRDATVWKVVRDGGMATRADYGGITSIGIQRLDDTLGPLVPFHPKSFLAGLDSLALAGAECQP